MISLGCRTHSLFLCRAILLVLRTREIPNLCALPRWIKHLFVLVVLLKCGCGQEFVVVVRNLRHLPNSACKRLTQKQLNEASPRKRGSVSVDVWSLESNQHVFMVRQGRHPGQIELFKTFVTFG